MKKRQEKNNIILIVVLVFLMVTVLIYGMTKSKKTDYNNLKIDETKYLVYAIVNEDNGDYQRIVPYINIKGRAAEVINQDIIDYTDEFSENVDITYEYNLNGQILSVVLKIDDRSYAESASIYSFRVYNFNLETMELVSEDSLLNLFELSKEDVKNQLEYELQTDYNQQVSSGLLSGCNYNCYLSNKDITNYMDKLEYYVREGKLVVFLPQSYMRQNNGDEPIYEFTIE